jgi:hypothetical protein
MSQYITEELSENELVYAINVLDVQEIAKEKIGRELDFYEMNAVKKGIEWGFFDWNDIVNVAIDNAVEQNKN